MNARERTLDVQPKVDRIDNYGNAVVPRCGRKASGGRPLAGRCGEHASWLNRSFSRNGMPRQNYRNDSVKCGNGDQAPGPAQGRETKDCRGQFGLSRNPAGRVFHLHRTAAAVKMSGEKLKRPIDIFIRLCILDIRANASRPETPATVRPRHEMNLDSGGRPGHLAGTPTMQSEIITRNRYTEI